MRFRFTLRDWMWLVVVVALAATWWIDRRRLTTQFLITIGEIRQQQWSAEARADSLSGQLGTMNFAYKKLYTTLKKQEALLRQEHDGQTGGTDIAPRPDGIPEDR